MLSRFLSHWSRFPAALLVGAVVGLGGVQVYEYLDGDCCAPGAACCYPGSPCCDGELAQR
jgi:hypothetical protein